MRVLWLRAGEVCLASFDLQPGDHKTLEEYGFMNGTITTMRIKAKFSCEKVKSLKQVRIKILSSHFFISYKAFPSIQWRRRTSMPRQSRFVIGFKWKRLTSIKRNGFILIQMVQWSINSPVLALTLHGITRMPAMLNQFLLKIYRRLRER